MTTTEKILTEAREIAFRADPCASESLVIEVFRTLRDEYAVYREPVTVPLYNDDGETLH